MKIVWQSAHHITLLIIYVVTLLIGVSLHRILKDLGVPGWVILAGCAVVLYLVWGAPELFKRILKEKTDRGSDADPQSQSVVQSEVEVQLTNAQKNTNPARKIDQKTAKAAQLCTTEAQ